MCVYIYIHMHRVIYPLVNISIDLSIRIDIFMCISIELAISLSTCISVYPSIHVSLDATYSLFIAPPHQPAICLYKYKYAGCLYIHIYRYIRRLSCLSVRVSIDTSVDRFIGRSVDTSMCRCIYIIACVYLYMYIYLYTDTSIDATYLSIHVSMQSIYLSIGTSI